MPDNFEYVALVALRAPGTMVFGYQPGDQVPADVVANWGLEVGEQVMPRRNDVVARPEDTEDRGPWAAYAYGQGWTKEQVEAATLDDLKAIEAPDPDEPGQPIADPNAPPERPEPSALKSDWVTYVIAMGADKAWAEDKATTKADLQDYTPSRDVVPPTAVVHTPPSEGDPVAEAASDLNHASEE